MYKIKGNQLNTTISWISCLFGVEIVAFCYVFWVEMLSKILKCTCSCLFPPPSCCVAGLAMYSCAISLEAEKAKNCFEQKGKAKKCGTFCRLSHFSGESGRQMAITFKAKYTFDDNIYILRKQLNNWDYSKNKNFEGERKAMAAGRLFTSRLIPFTKQGGECIAI